MDMNEEDILNGDIEELLDGDIEELPEIAVEPWQKVAEDAVREYQLKRGFIDVGQSNKYMMWARIDLAGYEKAEEFCGSYGTEVNHVINAVIHVKLENLEKKCPALFWNYVKYLFGRNKKYMPFFITETDVKSYLKWLAEESGVEFN
jgi:hypothetical protein